MRHILIQPDFNDWRTHARQLLQHGYVPQDLDLQDATVDTPLTLALEPEAPPSGHTIPSPHVPKAFLEAAEIAAVHRDPARWNLLYRVLHRLQTDRNLLKIEIDPDVTELLRLEAQVKRDLHKMHAFVRFRKVLEPGEPVYPEGRPVVVDEPVLVSADPHPSPEDTHHLVLETPTPFGPVKSEIESCEPAPGQTDPSCEHFIAWYQPDHRILPLAVPFFSERFSIMRWTIITPDASAAWDPVAKQVTFAPGLPRDSAPAEDELEDLWRSYYSSIFNPARLNPTAMRSEMPVRYWKNLPEISLLPNLITRSKTRVDTMVTRQQSQPTAQPFVPAIHTLAAIDAALPTCKGCDLYLHATQVVPGSQAIPSSGPSLVHIHQSAALMLVGEQPGDQEDLQGLPFVGPAGRVLDAVLADLRIERSSVYVTNAVKHFKFIQRGKLRLHQSPRMSEINACRPWLQAEIDAVKPRVVVCLGASAAKSLLGGTFALMRDHGKVLPSPYAEKVIATIHPSAVLRARDDESRHQLRHFLAEDLAHAWRTAQT